MIPSRTCATTSSTATHSATTPSPSTMSSDTPPLQLSDIMVTMSPTPEPAPTKPSELSTRRSLSRSPSPDLEALDEEEIEDIRKKALDIQESLKLKGKGKEAAREHELVRMVLRLASGIPLRSQVLAQAETIAQLSQQREFFLERMQDERTCWEAERESWTRVAEVLIAQANKFSPSIYKEQASSMFFIRQLGLISLAGKWEECRPTRVGQLPLACEGNVSETTQQFRN